MNPEGVTETAQRRDIPRVCPKRDKLMAQTSFITGQYVCVHQVAATVLQRVVAFLVDLCVMFFSSLIVGIIVGNLAIMLGSGTIVLMLILNIPILMYPLLMEVFNHGQSLGKKLVGIKVVCLDGSTPPISSYILRWVLLLVDTMAFIGLTCIVFTRNSQRLGDLAAGTTVVSLAREGYYGNLFNFSFAESGYQPIYPQATNLSMSQFRLIASILSSRPNALRNDRILRLAEKTRRVMGVNVAPGTDAEYFLVNVYNDYQYFMSKMV